MKVTVVLLATIVGLDSCDRPADITYLKQPYDTIEKCLAVAEVIATLDHVKKVECVERSMPLPLQ